MSDCGSDVAEDEVHSVTSEIEQEVRALGEDVPEGLSYIGGAAYTALSMKHPMYKNVCWNVTHGKVVGELAQTPPMKYWQECKIDDDCSCLHSDAFPERMAEIISRGREFVDFSSLGPPDGKFLEKIAGAIKSLHDSGNAVTVRVLTGNIVGMPTDNAALLKALAADLPSETNIKLWIGSWRKGLSWNHSKIIAIDGKYLFTGGHNVWDPHYLKWNPVRDVSMEAEGQVAQDGHVFINRMWKFIITRDTEMKSRFGIFGFKPHLPMSKCGIVKFPQAIDDYPPMYEYSSEPLPLPDAFDQGDLAIISCGRYGELHHNEDTANPSDSAITAMLACAQKSIKMCLQDLGPLALPLPTGPMAIPGGVWPQDYLRAVGSAIYERGVDVHIVVSFPNSIPADLSMTDANYGNGWTCEDVASEVVKSIRANYPDCDEERLSGLVGINLKVAYMRSNAGPCDWSDKVGLAGNHAKFFIVDDICYYVGSQNLYIANLAEWGLIIDNAEQTQKVMDEYWNLLWHNSYENVPEEERLDVGKVLEGCDVDRNGPPVGELDDEQYEQMLLLRQGAGLGGPTRRLVVWLKSATELKDADGFGSGSSDAYVRFRLVDSDGNTVSIPVESRVLWDAGKNPEWNEQFVFEGLQTPAAYTLKVAVLDKDSLLGLKGDIADWLASEDELGNATLHLGTLSRSKNWQHQELTIADGWFSGSTVKIACNTDDAWGN